MKSSFIDRIKNITVLWRTCVVTLGYPAEERFVRHVVPGHSHGPRRGAGIVCHDELVVQHSERRVAAVHAVAGNTGRLSACSRIIGMTGSGASGRCPLTAVQPNVRALASDIVMH